MGKTTIAKMLAEKLNAVYVSVAELALNENMVLGYDERRAAYVIDERALRARLRELSSTKRVIVDSHVASAVPPEIVDVAVILRLDPRELEKRLSARGYPRDKVVENVQAEVLDVCLIEAVRVFGFDAVFEVDTSGKKPEEVLDEILNILIEKKGMKPGSVNWFERLGEVAYDYLKENYINT